MSDLATIQDAYSPIWDMVDPRRSCVVPEQPLYISRDEERDLIDIARGVWRAMEAVIDIANTSNAQPWQSIKNSSKTFPDGLTLPPAIRIDTVRSIEGFRVVEVDPVTAISLGETALLAEVWQNSGSVIEAPTAQIARSVKDLGESQLVISLPSELSDYQREVRYLAAKVKEAGQEVAYVGYGDPEPEGVQLSAFMENPRSAKIRNKVARPTGSNPLYGSLYSLASKDKVDLLRKTDNGLLQPYLTKEFSSSELDSLGSREVICKPTKGMGSRGIVIAPATTAKTLGDGFVFQELLLPTCDYFGECLSSDGTVDEPKNWVSRVSIYASSKGLSGAQVTARRQEGRFTNAHGQSDAIQTAIVVE